MGKNFGDRRAAHPEEKKRTTSLGEIKGQTCEGDPTPQGEGEQQECRASNGWGERWSDKAQGRTESKNNDNPWPSHRKPKIGGGKIATCKIQQETMLWSFRAQQMMRHELLDQGDAAQRTKPSRQNAVGGINRRVNRGGAQCLGSRHQ